MVKRRIVLSNESGLHARPASNFVNLASKFKAKITIKKDETAVDGKSIIHLLTLGASKGTEIEIIAEGEDASEAVKKLCELIETDFD